MKKMSCVVCSKHVAQGSGKAEGMIRLLCSPILCRPPPEKGNSSKGYKGAKILVGIPRAEIIPKAKATKKAMGMNGKAPPRGGAGVEKARAAKAMPSRPPRPASPKARSNALCAKMRVESICMTIPHANSLSTILPGRPPGRLHIHRMRLGPPHLGQTGQQGQPATQAQPPRPSTEARPPNPPGSRGDERPSQSS